MTYKERVEYLKRLRNKITFKLCAIKEVGEDELPLVDATDSTILEEYNEEKGVM